MSEVLVVTSGKGGVGKSTCAANIGWGLAELGKKVVLVDTDIGLRNLDVILGMENLIVYHLIDVIEERCSLRQALLQHKEQKNLYFLPSAQTRSTGSVKPEQMKKLCDDLRARFDYVILDCPAGMDQGFQNAVAGADKAVLVTTPEVTAVRDADRIAGILEEQGVRDITLLINRMHPDLMKKGILMSVDDVTDLLPYPVAGLVADDESFLIAAGKGESIFHYDCPGKQAFSNICHRILGEEVPYVNFEKKKGFWERIFGK